MRKSGSQIQENPVLLNMISPMGLKFHKNTVDIGENTAKVYGVVRYPQAPDYGWLSKITNIPSTIVSLEYAPENDGTLLDSIDNNIRKKRAEANEAKSELEKSRAETAAKNGERLLRQIDNNNESVGMLGVCIAPLAAEEQAFAKVDRKVRSSCSAVQCRPRVLAYKQKAAYKVLSPTHTTDKDISMIIDRPVPLRTVMGGFPFASSGLNDGQGCYLGKDKNGNLIIYDHWLRAGDRTNTNYFVEGVPGVGKSTIIKSIIISEYMMGGNIIIFDPQGDYKDLTDNLNGDWINAGGAENGKVNPLQIRPVPRDEEDKDDYYSTADKGMGDLAVWMKHLEVFFSIRWKFTSSQLAILKKALLEVYNNFGITWDTDVRHMPPEAFPIMEDLYNRLQSMKEESEDDDERRDYRHILLLLEDAVHGADAFLWNGHSTVKANSRCVCFDTTALNDFSDECKCAQYNNLFTYAWQKATQDRHTRFLIVVDEAYLMADKHVPQSLTFLRNALKQDRKFETGLAVITHSVVDFMAEEIKQYGQTIMDVPTYKILMGTDGQNLRDLKELYNLTEAEESLLAAKQRGHSLFMVGSKRLHAIWDIPEYKQRLMGNRGGR